MTGDRQTLQARNERIAALYNSGLTFAEVAGHVGMSISGVHHALARCGIVRRRQGPQQRGDKALIRAAHASGKSFRKVGAEFGISATRVWTIVHELSPLSSGEPA